MKALWATGGLVFFMIVSYGIAGEGDKYEAVKKELTSAQFVKLEVAVAVVSRVFNDVDSSEGSVCIAEDGRYYANLDSSIYLFDGKCTWDVSLRNRQATKKCLKEDESFDSRLSFLKNLDEYYRSSVIRKGREYDLMLKDKSESSLPDSLRIFLDPKQNRLLRLEYYDLNGDMNRVHIISQDLSSSVDSNTFKINLPDSVEVISLP